MAFFDFHLHPTLKTLFSHNNPAKNQTKISPYAKIDTRKIPFILRWCTELDFILSSQSNLDQLFRNDVKLFGFPLFIPDTALMDNAMVKKSSKTDMKEYIQKEQLDKLIKKNPFKNLIEDDLPTLLDSSKFNQANRKINVLKKKSDYVESDPNTINVFFTIEGLHTLCNKPNKFDEQIIKANLQKLLDQFPVFATTLTHLQQSAVCNHAYGIQFINDDRFLPTGLGIKQLGYKMIEHLIKKDILIDVKHMSLLSRRQLYNYLNHMGHNVPVICTHAGLTGISYEDIHQYVGRRPWRSKSKKVYKIKTSKPAKYGLSPRPGFNLNSLNLFDEDVIFILKSGGMIGLSLDKRILGFSEFENDTSSRETFPFNDEYVSDKEIASYFPKKTKFKIGAKVHNANSLSWDEIKDGGIVEPRLAEYHLTYFMQQILHIIVVAQNNGYSVNKTLKQICLGSDFDGVINPIWTCDSTDELQNFKQIFQNSFVKFSKDSGVNLLASFRINSFTEDLFYRNGKNFVLERLK